MSVVFVSRGFQTRILSNVRDEINAIVAGSRKLNIYGGTPPAHGNDYSEGAYSSGLLVQWTGYTVTLLDTTTTRTLKMSTPPSDSTKNAALTGTASWYAIVAGTFVCLGEVSLISGTGSVILSSLNLVQGSPVSLVDFGIKVTYA